MLYPLTFEPIFKDRVWGGGNLAERFGKAAPPDKAIGESWEISDRPGDVSVVANGPLKGKSLRWLLENHRDELMGAAELLDGRFPLLVKLLDAEETLSLQVHPPASKAAKLGGDPKTEMWYVAHARPDAELLVGLKRGVTKADFKRRLAEGTVAECFHKHNVKAGDAMFLPSGRVHAIGAGNLIFEIQQNSDTTYRVFDWNRKGLDGKPRELHLAASMESINFSDFEPSLVPAAFENRRAARARTLVDVPLFQVQEFQVNAGVQIPFFVENKPVIVGVVSGSLKIDDATSGVTVQVRAGGFCLLPACLRDLRVVAESAAVCLLTVPGKPEPIPPVSPNEPPLEAFDEAAPEQPPVPEDEESPDAEPPPTGEQKAVTPAWEAYKDRGRKSSGSSKPKVGLGSRRHIKRELTRRLTYWPLLKILILNRWFRLLFLLCLGAVLFLAVLLPKVWLVTPEDFTPEIRISWLDRVQAIMLRRTALAAQKEKRFEEAAHAWRSAFVNNPGDPELARGLILNALEEEPPTSKVAVPAVQIAMFLLRLTSTNTPDLEISVRLFEKYSLNGLIDEALRGDKPPATSSLRLAKTKALFQQRRIDAFVTAWSQLPEQEKKDPEIAIYRAAYEAGWGPAETATRGREALEAAAREGQPFFLLAVRLQLGVAAQLSDLRTFRKLMETLHSHQADGVAEHVQLWRMMIASNETDQARELARAYAGIPRNATDVVRLAEIRATLGLKTEAIELLRRYAPDYSYTIEVWTTLSNLLIDSQKWDDLKSASLQLRQDPTVGHRLEGFGAYLEGRAEFERKHADTAARLFDKAASGNYESPLLALAVAKSLEKLAFAPQSETLLTRFEDGLKTIPDYWETAFEAALRNKNQARLLKAASWLYKQAPSKPEYVNRYAASLLVCRERPEEAVNVTLQLLGQYPNSLAARLNHALALCMNHRAEEAAAILRTLNPEALRPDEANVYHLARFEMFDVLRDTRSATNELGQIQHHLLFPAQRQWLDARRKALLPAK